MIINPAQIIINPAQIIVNPAKIIVNPAQINIFPIDKVKKQTRPKDQSADQKLGSNIGIKY